MFTKFQKEARELGRGIWGDERPPETTPEIPPKQTGDIIIQSVSLEQEFVIIKNTSNADIDMTGWKLVSTVGDQTFTENLRLGTGLIASPESFIPDKARPVIIEEITIYNPADLPAIASNGKRIDRTTIHVVLEVPLEIRFVGLVYGRMNVFVDIDTFVN